jgi:radical SAM superfamily enzyme YgiQ (UPF0313 family)
MAVVCLVRPPLVLPHATVNTAHGVPSVGLAYLAAALKAAGHRVVVVDAFGEALNATRPIPGTGLVANGLLAQEVVARVPADVDVMGVSCMFSNEWCYAKTVVAALHAAFPKVPLVLGGEHVTAEPAYTLETAPGARCAVLGEGEETLVELVAALASGAALEGIPGLALRGARGGVVRTAPRRRIRAVDAIPVPSWEEVPLERYLDAGLGMASSGRRAMPMVASRGCPYQCAFCSNRQMWGSTWVARNPRLVVDEMKIWMRRYRVTHFEFHDLTAIVERAWILEFCALIQEEGLAITWDLPSGTRSEALDDEVLWSLHRSGCRRLTYAPESGSRATLARVKKRADPERMLASMRTAVHAGIEVKANMVVGFPDQTPREVLESLWYICRMAWAGVHDVAVFPFVPYPGSELYGRLVQEGRIPRDGVAFESFLAGNVYNEVGGMRSWSDAIPSRVLQAVTLGGMGLFYGAQFGLRPGRLARMAVRLARGEPRTMLDRALVGLVQNAARRRPARQARPAPAQGEGGAPVLRPPPPAVSPSRDRRSRRRSRARGRDTGP